jgi:cell division protein ZapA
MNQIEVQILGQGYLLGCPDGGETRLRDAAERVNAAMTRIRDAGKIRARDRIAVLAALNLAFDAGERPVSPPASTGGAIGPGYAAVHARQPPAAGVTDGRSRHGSAAATAYNGTVSAAHAGLYISLNQCSTSTG